MSLYFANLSNKLESVSRVSTDALVPRWDANDQSTPLVAKGRLYCTAGTRRDVFAMDADAGEMLWMYRPNQARRSGTRGGPGFGLLPVGLRQERYCRSSGKRRPLPSVIQSLFFECATTS